jgi:hypothetical protein
VPRISHSSMRYLGIQESPGRGSSFAAPNEHKPFTGTGLLIFNSVFELRVLCLRSSSVSRFVVHEFSKPPWLAPVIGRCL